MIFNKAEVSKRFEATVDNFQKTISGLNTRVSPNILDSIKCHVYENNYPIKNFANITLLDASSLIVQVWDASATDAIYKSIQTSGICNNPIMEGGSIKVILPPMTQERRKGMQNVVKEKLEEAKVATRNIRRNELDTVKRLLKNKEISEDDEKSAQVEIQRITDGVIKELEAISTSKIADIAKV